MSSAGKQASKSVKRTKDGIQAEKEKAAGSESIDLFALTSVLKVGTYFWSVCFWLNTGVAVAVGGWKVWAMVQGARGMFGGGGGGGGGGGAQEETQEVLSRRERRKEKKR